MTQNVTAQTTQPTPEQLKELSKVLAEVASHPEFTKILKEIEQTPESERLAKATRLASVDELTRRGIPVPEGFRLTTRYFENPSSVTRGDVAVTLPQLPAGGDELERITVCASVGYIVCASVGGEVLQ
ncbi:hypothetical protein [Streptomyces sp. SLBN-118]|uniref:hypothetical protein n=1 Tax=Streptomyces sp. SLBN-118 TaxID=2768454 RepID=UPI001150ECCE|nr:hypothetical protein [Streptomyces sp. SLBN-118]